MRPDYEAWLRHQGYDEGTIAAQLARCGRVEQYFGDLDHHFRIDGLAQLLAALRYSTDDERGHRPNPTPIPIRGVLRTNLASYRSAVQRYGAFSRGEQREVVSGPHAERPETHSVRAESARSANGGAREPTQAIPPEHARTFADFGFDGQTTLSAMISVSRYRTLAQAVASLAVFSHPDTVAQTGGRALFPTVRGVPGRYTEVAGRRLMEDDNKSPTDAFLWANGIRRRGRDTQFNHVYAVSADPDAYTALANICMTPAFLAKLTDTSAEIRRLLQYRSYDLYGWMPAGRPPPDRPESYPSLEWAAPLPPVGNVREEVIARMARRPKDRTVIAVGEVGWLFS